MSLGLLQLFYIFSIVFVYKIGPSKKQLPKSEEIYFILEGRSHRLPKGANGSGDSSVFRCGLERFSAHPGAKTYLNSAVR